MTQTPSVPITFNKPIVVVVLLLLLLNIAQKFIMTSLEVFFIRNCSQLLQYLLFINIKALYIILERITMAGTKKANT